MKKILATILAISMIFSTLVIGFGTTASAETAGTENYVYSLDDVGKTVHVPYAESTYDCVVNFGSNIRISEKENVTIEQNGVDGSYAMTILGTGSTESVVLTMGPGVNQLENGKTYIFELTAKSTGIVPNIRLGLRGGQKENYGSWKRNNATDAIADWTVYTQEINNTNESPAAQVWEGFRIEWKVEAGQYLYIDNLKVYEKDDASKTNLFPNGTFEKSSYYSGDKSAMVPYTITDYDTHKQASKLSALSGVSIVKEGVNGSYCLKSEGNGTLASPYLGLSDSTGLLVHNKTYVISVKVKVDGTVNNFRIGSLYSSVGGWGSASGWFVNGSGTIADWTTYTHTVYYGWDNTTESTKAWDELQLQWKAPEGSTVYIDDIAIYAQDDVTQTNLFVEGGFEVATSYASELADDSVNPKYSYNPYNISDFRMGASTNSDGTSNWNEWDHSTGIGDSNLAAITEDGIGGSYALALTGDDNYHQLAIKTAPNTVGLLNNNTSYVLRFKARTSNEESLDMFSIGLMRRWDWNTPEYGMKMATPSADIGLTEIDTEWREYACVVTTDDGFEGAWTFVYLDYRLIAGDVLYIDDIEIYDVNGKNYSKQGSFDMPVENFNKLDTDANFNISPKYYGDWLASNGNSTVPVEGFNAEVIAIDNAKSGNNVLALGFNDAAYNGRVWYELGCVRPGKTYVVEFWAMLVGDITDAAVTISDNDAYAPSSMTDEEGNEIEVPEEILAEYGTPEDTSVFRVTASDSASYPRTWQKITVEYTDTTTSELHHRWAGMNISAKGAAGSGLLIDSVSIKEVAEFGDEAPNLFADAGFEKQATPAVVWNDTYFGSNVTDLSFMDTLPNTIGAFGANLRTDVARFKDILSDDSDFAFLGLYHVDESNIEIARFEAKKAAAAGKEVWLSANRLVSRNGALVDDWQAKLDEMAAWIQNDIGDAFQGVYFDEPHLHFASDEEFVTITRYIRETYKKRVFSMTKHDMFSATSDANVHLTPESHAYVTDVGYWNYQLEGMQTRIEGFHTAASALNADVRKWICPLLGAKNDALTEEDTMTIFNSMLDSAKTIEGFGGIMLYSLGDSNGYELLGTNAEGVAEYNNYRNLLLAVAEDFETPFASFDKQALNINGENVIIVDGGLSVEDAVAMFGTYGVEIVSENGVVTGVEVSVEALTGSQTRTYSIAVLNDVNGDGETNVKDLIRMKKIASGRTEGSCAEYAAAGTTLASGIGSAELVDMRKVLLG